ncbi:sugar-binding protein [Rugamonas sp. CCM 8940]|nr:sugar-binding protein [Rugamonas sp. CCM 8940]
MTTTRGSTFTYDGAPNLRCVNCSDSTRKIEYAYDGRNRRIAVTKAGIKTYEMYSAQGNLMVEYTPSQQNRLVEYIYVGDKRVAQRVTP